MMQMGFKEWFMVNPPIISTILIFSVLLVAFSFERMWIFRREATFPRELWERIVGLIREKRLRDAIALCEVSSGVFSKVFKAGLEGSLVSRLDAEDGMVIEKEEGQEILRKRVGLFGTISFISPLIGLLGTVLGVLRAFHDLAKSGSGGPSVVAAGISEALITTVAGLVVAVPAAMIYNYFNFRLRAVLVEMNTYGQRLLLSIFGEKR
ncbi:MAG: MotA/TolQ/ExbB proton channel family protein [Elusimicrobia bacterium]|jgi:biopolymer transport protein ExbB|nr:MotA/TolQ/ExbB proton channel family protein [Elusimicrobiota bacterium]MBK7208032.1 MotA/TolQ/ExbB proton channel family protein [Elusimicrobiota bacterium]MBK7544810.1 MotA/TolQ/ExbB proton channel family protein [Elusimicrobiota bacterium]MBK7574322.1 MotA/TolQ/ExbB proton channel family protein [Elusimicrobiota bacterium]MBK7688314.1 MotA/TolQ/ExbB proton channel family protein [Elusimicrobiota bacterium]